jgi:threonine/homoserine/homoserine lactone efflux protein
MFVDLVPLATYCFLMSSTPGPNNVLLTTSGANFGYRGSLPHIFGVIMGSAVQTFVTCLGLGAIFTAYPDLHAVLRVAGAGYLLFLAWRLAMSSISDVDAARPLKWAEAALFQAVNPKSWMKAVTLASVFMPAGLPVVEGSLLVAVVGVVIGFPCISAWALFGVAIRGVLQNRRSRGVFNAIMAGTLALLALKIFLD